MTLGVAVEPGELVGADEREDADRKRQRKEGTERLPLHLGGSAPVLCEGPAQQREDREHERARYELPEVHDLEGRSVIAGLRGRGDESEDQRLRARKEPREDARSQIRAHLARYPDARVNVRLAECGALGSDYAADELVAYDRRDRLGDDEHDQEHRHARSADQQDEAGRDVEHGRRDADQRLERGPPVSDEDPFLDRCDHRGHDGQRHDRDREGETLARGHDCDHPSADSRESGAADESEERQHTQEAIGLAGPPRGLAHEVGAGSSARDRDDLVERKCCRVDAELIESEPATHEEEEQRVARLRDDARPGEGHRVPRYLRTAAGHDPTGSSPRVDVASASATRAIWSEVSSGNIGSDRRWEACSSAIGNSPGSSPRCA